MQEKYGNTNVGRGCLMARRLVEVGVPFVEVDFGGWDLHQNCFTTLETKLPELDQAFSALIEDLAAARAALEHGGALHGRVRPHAADQRRRGPRPLRPGVERGARRRRHPGRPGDRQDERRRHDASRPIRIRPRI